MTKTESVEEKPLITASKEANSTQNGDTKDTTKVSAASPLENSSGSDSDNAVKTASESSRSSGKTLTGKVFLNRSRMICFQICGFFPNDKLTVKTIHTVFQL